MAIDQHPVNPSPLRPVLGKARQLTELLAGRWSLYVFAELVDGGHRYQDLHDALDGISRRC